MRSAQKAFESQALPACQMLPPAYLALHNPRCLDFVRDMCDALDAVQWQTCVVCWRAWFAVPTGYRFQPPVGTRNKKTPSWLNFQDSTVLRASRRKEVDRWHMTAATPGSASDANLFLERNYDPASIKEIKERLQEPTQKRVAIICTSCNPHVEDGVLRPPMRGCVSAITSLALSFQLSAAKPCLLSESAGIRTQSQKPHSWIATATNNWCSGAPSRASPHRSRSSAIKKRWCCA